MTGPRKQTGSSSALSVREHLSPRDSLLRDLVQRLMGLLVPSFLVLKFEIYRLCFITLLFFSQLLIFQLLGEIFQLLMTFPFIPPRARPLSVVILLF